jgi:hypothetical protein
LEWPCRRIAGQERQRQKKRMRTTQANLSPCASISEHKKRIKKESKTESQNYRSRKSKTESQATIVTGSQPRSRIASGQFSPSPLRLIIQEPPQLTGLTLSLAVGISHHQRDVGYTVPPVLSPSVLSTHSHHQPWPHPPAVRLRRSRLPAATRAIRPWHHRRRIDGPQQTTFAEP